MNWKNASAWLLMLAIGLLSCTYGYYSVQLGILNKQVAEHRAKAEQREYAKSVAWWAQTELQQHEYATKEKLTRAKSRNDFAVRSGAQFACAKLCTSSEHSLRMGIYVPPGSHSFCYSSLMVLGNDSGDALGKQFSYGDPNSWQRTRTEFDVGTVKGVGPEDSNSPVASIPLNNVPEVFELRVELDVSKEVVSIVLIGSDDKMVHEATISLPDTKLNYRLGKSDRLETLTYPSELPLNNFTGRVLQFGTTKPVLDLSVVFGSSAFEIGVVGKKWMTRIWIDSDAPACISAYNAEFKKGDIIDKWRLQRANEARVDEILFEPYAGGLVRKLRPEALRARK